MATPSKTPRAVFNPVVVMISTDPVTKQIEVFPEQFWVSRAEKQQVMWVCKQNHTHGSDCFRAHFDEGSPFTQTEFTEDLQLSGDHDPNAQLNKPYKYTIEVRGFAPLDPLGGVKP